MEAVKNTEKPMINLFELHRANEEKYRNTRGRFDHSVEHCELCGRKLSQKPNSVWSVEVGIDGFEFGRTNETESQGSWSLGSECRKLFPTAVKAGA